MMKFGFAKQDITPRLGVELYGYSGYLNRYATAVRDHLYARSIAVSDGQNTAVAVSCDLVFITRWLSTEVRRLVCAAVPLAPEAIMVHATHTHSGPAIRVDYRNAYDPPYMELLPRRIAQACIAAFNALEDAELLHAEVPCEGMGTNRVYDSFNYKEAALDEGFRPEKPELTDTTCHVLKAVTGNGRMLGFVSYFGCHNVVGGSGCTYISGDYAGIATGMLEREYPGTTGVFLQGAEGDINTAACVFGNDKVLQALDIMAGRYARAVRNGLNTAKTVSSDGPVKTLLQDTSFSRLPVPLEELRKLLAGEQAVIDNPAADDADLKFRMAILRRQSIRSLIERSERGESFENEVQIQGLRFGPVTLLGAPFEIFHAIKEDIARQAKAPIPLVLGLCNDEQGYATDREAANASMLDRRSYEARTVPIWKHTLPYADIHAELSSRLLAIDAELNE